MPSAYRSTQGKADLLSDVHKAWDYELMERFVKVWSKEPGYLQMKVAT
jgi:hypothetical protein